MSKDIQPPQCVCRVITLGNLLHGDDGAGPVVFKQLQQTLAIDGVEVIDGGVGGIRIFPWLHCPWLIFVDAVSGGDQPGQVEVFEDIQPDQLRPSISIEHGGRLPDVLALLPLLIHPLPRVDLWLIHIHRPHCYDVTMNTEVLSAIDDLCNRLKLDLAQKITAAKPTR